MYTLLDVYTPHHHVISHQMRRGGKGRGGGRGTGYAPEVCDPRWPPNELLTQKSLRWAQLPLSPSHATPSSAMHGSPCTLAPTE